TDYRRKDASAPDVVGGPFVCPEALDRHVPDDGFVALPLRCNACGERYELAAIVSSKVIVELVEDPDEPALIQRFHFQSRPRLPDFSTNWRPLMSSAIAEMRQFPARHRKARRIAHLTVSMGIYS